MVAFRKKFWPFTFIVWMGGLLDEWVGRRWLYYVKLGRVGGFGNENLLTVVDSKRGRWVHKSKMLTFAVGRRGSRVESKTVKVLLLAVVGLGRVEENKIFDGREGG